MRQCKPTNEPGQLDEEADALGSGHAARTDDDRQNEQADDRDDLDAREPELELAERPRAAQVDEGDDDPERGDVSCRAAGR